MLRKVRRLYAYLLQNRSYRLLAFAKAFGDVNAGRVAERPKYLGLELTQRFGPRRAVLVVKSRGHANILARY
jgi:hypothetical protein